MRRIFLTFTFIAAAALVLAACGSRPGADANAANANSVQLTSFANITDPAAALAEGNRLFDTNDIENAIEAYKRAVELDPKLGEAYFKMGIAYALLETEARQSGNAERLPGDPLPKGESQEKPNSVKMFEKAVEVYKDQLKDSKDAAGYFNLGLAYNKLDKDDAAEDALAEAVKLKPDDSEYQTELGSIRIKLAKYHEAIAALNKAVELDPDNTEAADLLEDAQAGARRVDYVSPRNDDKKGNSNANANADANTSAANSNSAPPANRSPQHPDPNGRDRIVPAPRSTPKPAPTRH